MALFHKIRLYIIGLYNPKEGRRNSLILWLAYFCWNTFKRSRNAIIRAGYSSSTIAEYFRKQGARIGEDCDIYINELALEPYLVSLGNHVFISRDVTFHTHDGGVWVFRDKIPGIRNYGPIIIEDNCLIGSNVTLLPNIRIGRNSIVGAGSVVISDIPPNSIVMGVPARVISSIAKYEENCLSKWNEQKPPDLLVGKDQEWWRYKENQVKLRKHLLNLFADRFKSEKENTK